MIKVINITPLNTSNTLEYICENKECNNKGTVYCSTINVDNKGNPIESLNDLECQRCGKSF